MKKFIIICISVLTAIVLYLAIMFIIDGGVDRYTLVINKSSSSRDILRDKLNGCEYIKEKGESIRPLIVNGQHVCE